MPDPPPLIPADWQRHPQLVELLKLLVRRAGTQALCGDRDRSDDGAARPGAADVPVHAD